MSNTLTIDDVYEALIIDSNLSYEQQKYKVLKLVDALGDLGYIIETEREGREVPLQEITKKIYQLVFPNVMRIAYDNGSQTYDEKLDWALKMVDFFNKEYGANIIVKKDPLNPTSREYRPVEEIIDDLYVIQDKIYKNLRKDVILLNKNLIEGAEYLKKASEYKGTIDQKRSKRYEALDIPQQFGGSGIGDTLSKLTEKLGNLLKTIVPKEEPINIAIETKQGKDELLSDKDINEIKSQLDKIKDPLSKQKTLALLSARVFKAKHDVGKQYNKFIDIMMNMDNVLRDIRRSDLQTFEPSTEFLSFVDKFNEFKNKFIRLFEKKEISTYGELKVRDTGDVRTKNIHDIVSQIVNKV